MQQETSLSMLFGACARYQFPSGIDLLKAQLSNAPIVFAISMIGMPAHAQAVDDFLDRRLIGIR